MIVKEILEGDTVYIVPKTRKRTGFPDGVMKGVAIKRIVEVKGFAKWYVKYVAPCGETGGWYEEYRLSHSEEEWVAKQSGRR